ncbi:MAG: hypothetical protein IIW86_02385 [Clostridia bacterium]|nr:hypothetical protein [Clostridia bacterium]
MGKMIHQWYKNGDKGWKITFYTIQAVSVLLILVSFFIPPHGVIDSSVFAAVGELAFFPALYSFYSIIMSGRQATLKRGETEISVNDTKTE